MLLMLAGSAVQKLMQSLAKEEEVLMNIGNIAIYTYLAETVLLRVEKKIETNGESSSELDVTIAKTYFFDLANKIEKAAKGAILNFADGDETRMMLMGLKRYTKSEAHNPKEARQKIAQRLI